MGKHLTSRNSRRFMAHHSFFHMRIRYRLLLLLLLIGLVSAILLFFPLLTAQSPEVFVGTPTKTVTIHPEMSGFGPLTMDIGLTISNAPTASDVQEITANFPRPNIYIKINNPNSATLNASFQELYNKGYNFYFSLGQDSTATTFLTTFYSSFPSRPVVVEIRTNDNTSKEFMQQLKTNFPLIKLNVQPGTDWDIERAWEVYTKAQLRAPVLTSFAWGRFKRPESQPGLDWVFTEVNAWFDIFYDGGIDLNTNPNVGGDGHINYPQNSSTAFSDFRINTPDLKQNYSFLTGILSGAMVNSVQMQNDTSARYSSPITSVIYGDTNIPPGSPGKPILRYVADFTEQHPMIIWPLAAKGNGDPWDNQILPQSNSDPLVGVIGKIASGYYIIMTNTSASQTVAAKFPTGVDLTQYQFYSSQRGTGNFASGATQIIFDPLEVIIAAPTLGGAPPVPSSSPASPTPVAPTIPPSPPTSPMPTVEPTLTLTPTPEITNATPTPQTPATKTPAPPPVTTPAACVPKPVDIMLVFDHTPGIGPQTFIQAKTLGTKLVEQLMGQIDNEEYAESREETDAPAVSLSGRPAAPLLRMGVIAYGDTPKHTHTYAKLTSDKTAVLSAIGRIRRTHAGPCIHCGLRRANWRTVGASDTLRNDSVKITILFSEGDTAYGADSAKRMNQQGAMRQAMRAVRSGKKRGVHFFTIAMGSSPWERDLKMIASDPDDLYYIPFNRAGKLLEQIADATTACNFPLLPEQSVVESQPGTFGAAIQAIISAITQPLRNLLP